MNLPLTDELRSFVVEKLEPAFRAFGKMNLDPVKVDVELEKTALHQGKDLHRYRAASSAQKLRRTTSARPSSR